MRNDAPPSVHSVILGVLTRDTLVRLYLAIVVSEALIYSLPLMDPGALTAFGASPFLIPFVAVAVAAAFHGLSGVRDREERQFWGLLAYACVFWLAALVAIALRPSTDWKVLDGAWVDAAWLVFYAPVVFAAGSKPHLPALGGRRHRELPLRWAGVTLFVAGWFAYFVVAFAAVEPDIYLTTLPSSLLFVTMDAAIAVLFCWQACTCESPRWRVLYGTLALAALAVLVTDSIEALRALGVVDVPDGAKTDLLWVIPPFLFLLAFSLRDADLPREVAALSREVAATESLDPVRVGSVLVAGAVSFPIGHFALYSWQPFGDGIAQVHRLVVLAELVLLSALAAMAYRILERERLAAERVRTALESRVRQARTLEAVGRLAGVVADEYHGWLNVVGACVDRALDVLSPGDQLRDDVHRTAEQIHRANAFTNDLMAIGRQQRGRPVRLDLTQAVSSLLPGLQEAVARSIRIETDLSPGPCVTVIDRAHLRATLFELAAHARAELPRGATWRLETGAVELHGDAALAMALRPGRYARLTTRDARPAIPADVLAHIFEPFFTTESGERASELGLATVYALACQYGGTASVTSGPDSTTFEILLPSPE